MENNTYSPQHGDYQTTLEGNMLICLKKNGPGKFFFYMTKDGDYCICKYTQNTGLLPNKTEWNFLFSKTQKVSRLSEDLLTIAEDLIAYIVQDPKYPWKISDVRKAMSELAVMAETQSGSSFASIKGFSNLASCFAKKY